jgi:hypothetical protein
MEAPLNDITELAKLFFTPKQIAIILELDPDEFATRCNIEGTPEYSAFYRGQLISEKDLREKILLLASQGSSPAQSMALDMLKKLKMQMVN